jgi:serine/threonine protein kinase
MKKSAVLVKRLARARTIELNGPTERVELLLLIFMAPLWGLVFPLIGISILLSVPGVIMLAASLFCLLHFLHLNNSKFSFEENGLRLPGVDNSLHPYSSITSIYLQSKSPPLLAVEYIPDPGRSGKNCAAMQPEIQLFETQHLTEEGARQMWALCASHLKSCSISLDVRDQLVNWRTQAGKLDKDKTLAAAPAIAQGVERSRTCLVADDENDRSSQIARDLSMLVELKPFDPLKVVGQYMVSYSDTFRRTWLTCWTIVGAVAYPFWIGTLVTQIFADRTAGNPATLLSSGSKASESFSQIGQGIGNLSTISFQSVGNLFGNHLGAIGLFVLLTLAIYKMTRHMNDPDSVVIDYIGITTQRRTSAGVLPKEHRNWKTIDQIKLVRPTEHSNSSRWSIMVESKDERAAVELPFKAFSSDRIRHQLIQCLDTWGRNITIDPNLLEALAPRNQASYTELWISALSEAPKIEGLTPHSIGLRLESRAYEIVSQLASGGQGIAYLARKIKAEAAVAEDLDYAPEQVVLKETVLPIYVDDRAKAKALARFERDAKLLASLDHPFIVKLEDFFVENNRAYLALEYIPGQSLKETVESAGPLPEEEVRRLALMMVDILQYLHARTPPVVHRDFTPDNLMLTNDGKIKLLDFDVAMEQSVFSQTNATIVGKQAYIPLEQFRGKPCPQSDIYAMGATLSYLLTGCEPAALESSHPRLSRPELSAELDDIIARATALEISQRISDANTLRRCLQGESAAEIAGLEVVAAPDDAGHTLTEVTLTVAEGA